MLCNMDHVTSWREIVYIIFIFDDMYICWLAAYGAESLSPSLPPSMLRGTDLNLAIIMHVLMN
jgi:hypothetical protein